MSDTQVRRVAVTRRGAVTAALAVGLLLVVALGSYAAGRRGGNHVHVLTGNAYVGLHVASVKVDGWWYGVPGDVNWVDSAGSSHESGWPDCLARPGTTERIRFGEISVTGPQGDSWRQVAWVDCRGAVAVGN